MAESLRIPSDTAYDAVGRYDQDAINGFTDELLESMIELARLPGTVRVLDAMGGDGNLTRRILNWFDRNGLSCPEITSLDYSRVQLEFARAMLPPSVKLIWGDAIRMTDRSTGEPLPEGYYDRVLIKSGLHEIPLKDQLPLYRSVLRVLRPGGLFVNMGFVFDDADERQEFREITRVKDTMAGMDSAVEMRHFLTREELYERLEQAGFVESKKARGFEYRIRSEVASRAYFARPEQSQAIIELQASQARAMTLRRQGRIEFRREHSLMVMPGEITVASRPAPSPWHLVDESEAHHLVVKRIMSGIPSGARVLEPAGGEVPAEEAGTYDVAVMLNSLHRAESHPADLVRHALRALRPGGQLILGGLSGTRFLREAASRAGMDPASSEPRREQFRSWSVEGVLALLDELGVTPDDVDTSVYEGHGYLVVARV